jgi:succinate dehydrogenase/fumarate reductase flavoprotein subunit/uncharacterized protein with FMN-binding domain
MKNKAYKASVVGLFAAALVLGLVPGCGTSSSGNVTDGTYTASAEGFGGEDVSVTITVEDGKITDADVDASSQSEDYGQAAAEGLAEEIVEGQTYDIDTVSGATLTRDGVSAATKDAMSQAGFDVDNLTASATAGEDEEAEADILVIGMGASGSVAALKAAESGASVIGVEATDQLGGMGNAAQGMFAVGSVEQKDRYGEDGETTDEEYWYEHMQDRNDQLGNGKLIREFVAEAKNTVSYLLNRGVGFFLSEQPQQIAHFDTEIVYHRWNNADPFKYIGEALDKNGVDIRYNTTAEKLLTNEDGDVIGAECTKEDGGTLTVTAKEVIVSTGSFAGNQELMTETLGEEVYDNAMVMSGSDLPGIDMMWDVGAAKGELLTMNHGVVTMNAGDETVSELTLNTPILWVNSQGKRFMNEDMLKDTVEFSSAVIAQGGVAYTIVDQATVDRWTDETQENTGTWIHYWDQHGIVDSDGNPTIYHAPMSTDDWNAGFDALTEANEGGVFDTIEEVADFIGCDPDDLQETITNYNSYVASGVDEEFYKSKEDLVYSVSEGPYYVTKGHSGVLGALGGVNTNEKLQVLTADNEVINGLYATGNNVSGISYGAYQDVEGVGLGFSLTSGRLAGAYAAEACGYDVEKDTTELTETGEATMEEATARGMQGTTKK